jgi:chromate transporter
MPDVSAKPAEGAAPGRPGLAEALRVWLRIGCLSFGGPAAQIALMHRELVEQRRWVSERRFLQALNFCMLLPGPEAQQLATYLGWLMHGVKGGLVAGLLFILPGATVMLALSAIYIAFGAVPLVAALFLGLACAVLALVVEALLRVARRALRGAVPWLIAGAAFGALFVFAVPFPIVVLAALAAGFAVPKAFAPVSKATAADATSLVDAAFAADPELATRRAAGARRAGLVALALWLWPVALLTGQGLWGDLAWFFSQMAVVTFGGAYAVLAYVAQEAVENYRWLSAADMLAGLGLAETTPGPLILVLQFVGTLAGAREAGWTGGLLGALIVLWVTFAPCFAWIFLGAPFVERAQGIARLQGALAAVTAAVVGVIANLALWFALRVLFAEQAPSGFAALSLPVPASVNVAALALALFAAALLFGARLGLVRTLALTAGAGLLVSVAGLA